MINSIFYEPYAWFGREIIETSKALIPATSPSARYGLSVFEGIRSYLLNDGRGISIFRLNDHVDRLFYSAERMSLPIEFTKDSIPNIVERVIDRNNCYTDAYIRIDALSSGSGSWHSKEPATLMITITKQNMSTTSTKKPVSVGISNWRRIHESQMPPSVKAGANYINSRYAYLEVLENGFDLPVLVNQDGYISESSGACIMAVIDGKLVTPPLTAQILNSITRDTLWKVASNLGINREVRDINPREFTNAEEIFLCGTAAEITPVISVNGAKVAEGKVGKVTLMLSRAYENIVRSSATKDCEEWHYFIPNPN